MRRFLVKKTGDCGSPPTPKKPNADSERLVAAREYDDRRRRGCKAAWRDEFAWLTYEPAPADSDSNGAPIPVPRLPTVLLLSHRRSPCPSTRCSAHPAARVTG